MDNFGLALRGRPDLQERVTPPATRSTKQSSNMMMTKTSGFGFGKTN